MTGQTPQTLSPQGAQSLQTAGALKDLLLQALAGDRPLTVDLDGVDSIDASALQLLIAAQRSAQASGVAMTVACSAASPAAIAMRGLGFLNPDNSPAAADAQGWVIHERGGQ